MKKTSLKKLSAAVIIATGILGVTSIEAAALPPKIAIKITQPTGSSSLDAVAAGKGMPWLTCIAAGTPTKIGGKNITSTLDTLQFDIDMTNPDDDVTVSGTLGATGAANGNVAGTSDYDAYVVFTNHAATGIDAAHALHYFLQLPATPSLGGVPTLSNATFNTATLKALTAGAQVDALRYYNRGTPAPNATFNYKTVLFGGPISLEGLGLPQGLWSITTFMVKANGAIGTLPVSNLVTTGDTLMDPRNWAAWDTKTFILGTPFPTSTTSGIAAGTAAGTGVCL